MDQKVAKIFFLKKKVLFPYGTMPVKIRPSAESAALRRGDVVLAYPISSLLDVARHRGRIATIAELTSLANEGGIITMTLHGLARVALRRIIGLKSAEYSPLEESSRDVTGDITDELRKKCQEVIFLINVPESDKLIRMMNFIVDLGQMTDFIANYFIIDPRTRFRLYRETDPVKRGRMLTAELAALIESMASRQPGSLS